MRAEAEPKVCERCGRRFTQAKIVDYGRCTLCDGKLVTPDEALDRGVDENAGPWPINAELGSI